MPKKRGVSKTSGMDEKDAIAANRDVVENVGTGKRADAITQQAAEEISDSETVNGELVNDNQP